MTNLLTRPPAYTTLGTTTTTTTTTGSTDISDRVSFIILDTPVLTPSRIDYITLLPGFSSDPTLMLSGLRLVVCVIDQYSTYSGNGNTAPGTQRCTGLLPLDVYLLTHFSF